MAIRKRRRFPRARVDRPALVRLLQTDPTQEPFEDFAKARVLGAGGCMLESSEPLGFASMADILISLGDEVIRADTRVVWEKERRDRQEVRHEVGVEFLRISPEHRRLIEEVVAGARSGRGDLAH